MHVVNSLVDTLILSPGATPPSEAGRAKLFTDGSSLLSMVNGQPSAHVAHCVDTYIDLRARTGAAGEIVAVKCRSTERDGGGGNFRWQGTANADDDDGTNINPTGLAGSWVRVFDGPINVNWFGVRGDSLAGPQYAAANTAAINAMLALAGKQWINTELCAPAGHYYFTRTQADSPDYVPGLTPGHEVTSAIKFDDLSSVILRGAGDHATYFSYTAFVGETHAQRLDYAEHGAFLSITHTNFSRVQDIQFDARDAFVNDGSARASMCVIISSHGFDPDKRLPFKNCIYGCTMVGYNDVGVQIGSRGVDQDVNLDNESIIECVLDGSDSTGQAGGGQYGLRVSNTNTNNFLASHCMFQGNGTAGVEISTYPRATWLDHCMYANNSPDNTPRHADIIVRSNVGSFVRITDTIVEMDHHPFILQDASGIAGPFNVGDNVAGCSIIIDGFQCTYTWGKSPEVVTPYKIFDIQGCGANVLRNAIISGPSEDHPGATAAVWYHPLPGSSAGYRRLTTDNVHLYNGAVWDVLSSHNAGEARITWTDLGSSYSDNVYGQGLIRPHLRLSDRMQAFVPGNFRTPTDALDIPTDKPMVSTKTRAYVIDYERPEFTTTASVARVVFETLPVACRVKSVVCRTTPYFSGLPTGVTIQVGNTGGGAAAKTDRCPCAYVLGHDVSGDWIAHPVLNPLPGADPCARELSSRAAYADKPAILKGLSATDDIGPALVGADAYVGGDILSFGGPGQLVLSLVSNAGQPLGTGSATNLTGGICTVYVTYEEMIPDG